VWHAPGIHPDARRRAADLFDAPVMCGSLAGGNGGADMRVWWLVCVGVCGLMMGCSSGDVSKAELKALKADVEALRASLGLTASDDGAPGDIAVSHIRLVDREGRIRATLQVTEFDEAKAEPALVFWNEERKAVASLQVNSAGQPGLVFSGQVKQPDWSQGVRKHSIPNMRLPNAYKMTWAATAVFGAGDVPEDKDTAHMAVAVRSGGSIHDLVSTSERSEWNDKRIIDILMGRRR